MPTFCNTKHTHGNPASCYLSNNTMCQQCHTKFPGSLVEASETAFAKGEFRKGIWNQVQTASDSESETESAFSEQPSALRKWIALADGRDAVTLLKTVSRQVLFQPGEWHTNDVAGNCKSRRSDGALIRRAAIFNTFYRSNDSFSMNLERVLIRLGGVHFARQLTLPGPRIPPTKDEEKETVCLLSVRPQVSSANPTNGAAAAEFIIILIRPSLWSTNSMAARVALFLGSLLHDCHQNTQTKSPT